MQSKKLLIIIFPLLFILLLTGCIGKFMDGGECKYETISSFAVVKEINEKHVKVDYYTRFLFYTDQEYQERVVYHLPPVHVGEILPASLEHIVEGSCSPEGFYIKKYAFFGIKKSVVSFSQEGKIEATADIKVAQIASYFLSLKKEYPQASLILYARASKGTHEYRGNLLMRYSNTVKKMLISQGIDRKSMVLLPYNDEVAMEFIKPLPKDRVTFRVELNIEKI